MRHRRYGKFAKIYLMPILSALEIFIRRYRPILALISALMLALAFPDTEAVRLAWLAFVPLLAALYFGCDDLRRTFIAGWLFGTVYFIGTVWWLTYSPINYGGFPAWLAYILLVGVCMYVGLFPALFAVLAAWMFRRFGKWAAMAAPFIWVMTEYLRYWLSGNSWNAVGYSQAFGESPLLSLASVGGVYLVSFAVILINAAVFIAIVLGHEAAQRREGLRGMAAPLAIFAVLTAAVVLGRTLTLNPPATNAGEHNVVVVQVDVPMAGLTLEKWRKLRERHVEMTEAALAEIKTSPLAANRTTVVFPESPMNFMYEDDMEFRRFLADFVSRNDIELLFNSAEPDPATDRYFNSAVMVDKYGREIVQYDKIYLVPFGEFVPGPLRGIVPGLIGSFASGYNYNLFPLGDAKAGVMLCYESNFGQLSRRLVGDGADVLIEMTNDGYLGETPVLRQHLASAVFRAVETNRPVIRATNIGITSYVDNRGRVLESAPVYQEAIRIWQTGRSAGDKTLYVRFGDWMAWLGVFVTLGLIAAAVFSRRTKVSVQ